MNQKSPSLIRLILSFLMLVTALQLTFNSKAQSEMPDAEWDFHLNAVAVQNDLKNSMINEVGGGIGGSFLIRLNSDEESKKIDILFGIDGGYDWMGRYKESKDTVVFVNSGIGSFNLVTRFRPNLSTKIKPRVDLLVGIQSLVAKARMPETGWYYGKEIAINDHSKTFTYGAGFGLEYRPDEYHSLYIGMRYMIGGKVEYSDMNQLLLNDEGNYYFEDSFVKSTELMNFHFGVIIHMGS